VIARRSLLRRWSSLGAWLGQSDRAIAVLLAGAAFGLYGVTTGQLTGYEPETAGAAEGLIHSGALRVDRNSQIANGQAGRGRSGHYYAHTGLTQPLLEAPVYWVGERLDVASSSGRSVKWRVALLQLFDPLMAAIAVAAIFLLLRQRGRPRRLSLAVGVLAALASLIWPYAKIGMETTMMALLAVTLLSATWASIRGGAWRYALTGIAAGAMAASKPVGLILLLGLIPFARPTWQLPVRERWRAYVAFGVPLLVWVAAILWYNAYRTGSITNFDNPYYGDLGGAPAAAVGMLISPGKGLLWYSPLVLLGALGLRPLWRQDRQLAQVILITFVVNLAVISGSAQWTEDTWGPRYIVASAWLLLLPIAWWTGGIGRKPAVAVVAAIAAVVQFAGVFAWYGVSVNAARGFSGEPVYLYGDPRHPASAVAYGDDGPTWIPAASEARFQVLLLGAWIKEQITGTGFKIHYRPFWGRAETLDLTHTSNFTAPLPNFWWHFPNQSPAQEDLAVGLGVLGVGCALALVPAGAGLNRRKTLTPPARSTADDVQLVG
jgi:hypothetical protein